MLILTTNHRQLFNTCSSERPLSTTPQGTPSTQRVTEEMCSAKKNDMFSMHTTRLSLCQGNVTKVIEGVTADRLIKGGRRVSEDVGADK